MDEIAEPENQRTREPGSIRQRGEPGSPWTERVEKMDIRLNA